MLKRLSGAAGALILGATLAHGQGAPIPMEVAKDAECGCCGAWVERLDPAAYQVTVTNMEWEALARFKAANGVTDEALMGCHTAKVAGYTIEGHVPQREIDRLLAERPDAVGLAVPGMPMGSPGMDFGDDKEPFDVLLIRRDGSTEVFASYPGA
jgi:hypothetical protein